MYPYHRDEPPRAPWNHGEERGHEEFPLDGRNAPMEREDLMIGIERDTGENVNMTIKMIL